MVSVLTILGLLTLLAADAYRIRGVRTAECRLQHMMGYPSICQYPTDNATELMLHVCNITELTRHDLSGLYNLDSISLIDNAIAHLDPAIFSSVPTLEALTVNRNLLRELPAFPEGSCRSLTWLSLSSNVIERINNSKTFSHCHKLEYLGLSYNVIDYIHPELFRSLTELEHLSLYSNKLTYIPEQMFATNSKLAYLDIYENRLSYLPSNFVGSLSLKKFDFHGNPWQCACLVEVLVEAKRAGVDYYQHRQHEYNGSRPECAYAGGVPCRRDHRTTHDSWL